LAILEPLYGMNTHMQWN